MQERAKACLKIDDYKIPAWGWGGGGVGGYGVV